MDKDNSKNNQIIANEDLNEITEIENSLSEIRIDDTAKIKDDKSQLNNSANSANNSVENKLPNIEYLIKISEEQKYYAEISELQITFDTVKDHNPFMMGCLMTELNRCFEVQDILIYREVAKQSIDYLNRNGNCVNKQKIVNVICKNIAVVIAFGGYDKDLVDSYLAYFKNFNLVKNFIQNNEIKIKEEFSFILYLK